MKIAALFLALILVSGLAWAQMPEGDSSPPALPLLTEIGRAHV